MNEASSPGFGAEARRLLRAARGGTLATVTEEQPFASLVTPATAPDGSVLLLLSELSEHTRHLRAQPRCAVMVTGSPDGANPQTAPRLTLTGLASLEPDPALKARWVACHPYAAFYADFGDFNLWRVRPSGGMFIGGFARAYRLSQAELTPDPAAQAAIEAAEPDIIQHCNADHPGALAAIAQGAGQGAATWRMTACDVDGFDLVDAECSIRVAWPSPVSDAQDVRTALIHLASAARK